MPRIIWTEIIASINMISALGWDFLRLRIIMLLLVILRIKWNVTETFNDSNYVYYHFLEMPDKIIIRHLTRPYAKQGHFIEGETHARIEIHLQKSQKMVDSVVILQLTT